MRYRWIVPALAAAALISLPAPTPACPFCSATGTTLAGEVAQADFILYGSLVNAKQDPADPTALNKGTTEMTIDAVIKPHEMVAGKKSITIPRYVPPDPKNPNVKYLIFFNIVNGTLDPYRGDAVPADSKLPEYIKGAIAVKDKDVGTRLRYYFDYLENADLLVNSDAYTEFGYADYPDVREFAKKLKDEPGKRELLISWIKNPETRATRFGLYGLLIGHCGTEADAKLLRQLLDDPERSYSSGLDGVLAAYTLLDPKAGWDYVTAIAKNTEKDFTTRYAALRTVRFFWESRPDVIAKEKVLEAMKVFMDQPDLADMPIGDVRKWKQWQLSPMVLAYADKESHNGMPINNRAVLMFALAAAANDPKNTAAAEFVAKAKAKNAKQVEFLEDLLRDELKPPAKPADPKSTTPIKPPAK